MFKKTLMTLSGVVVAGVLFQLLACQLEHPLAGYDVVERPAHKTPKNTGNSAGVRLVIALSGPPANAGTQLKPVAPPVALVFLQDKQGQV